MRHFPVHRYRVRTSFQSLCKATLHSLGLINRLTGKIGGEHLGPGDIPGIDRKYIAIKDDKIRSFAGLDRPGTVSKADAASRIDGVER